MNKNNASSQSYYDVLGVNKVASLSEIKAAYVRRCKEFHPDIDPSNKNLHQQFLRIQQAYSVLSRPDTRREYDLSLQKHLNFEELRKRANMYRPPNSAQQNWPPDYKYYHNNFYDNVWRNAYNSGDGGANTKGQQQQASIPRGWRYAHNIVAYTLVTLLISSVILHYAQYRALRRVHAPRFDYDDRPQNQLSAGVLGQIEKELREAQKLSDEHDPAEIRTWRR